MKEMLNLKCFRLKYLLICGIILNNLQNVSERIILSSYTKDGLNFLGRLNKSICLTKLKVIVRIKWGIYMEEKIYQLSLSSYLDGERLLLRPMTLEDAADMYEYASDDETVRFVFEKHKDLAETGKNIANHFMKEPLGKYAIQLKKTGKMIGTIDIRLREEHNSAEIGYTLNKSHWGNGYVTEAGKLILELGFEKLGLERIYACHDSENLVSGKVLKRLGMTYEGTLRKNRIHKERYVDDVYYSILKEDYLT